MTTFEKDTVVVFTARSPKRIIAEGGSQAWVLNPARAKLCKWLVCTQNRHHPDHEFSDATEPHRSGFLIGRISGIERSPDESEGNRWLIRISEFAIIDIPELWSRGRNPVHYATLADLGIAPDELEFEEMPTSEARSSLPAHSLDASSPPAGLTIAQAKLALAATFGVSPDAVEITIRG